MNLSKENSRVQKLAISGIVIALYIVTMTLTQSVSFLEYQIRIATSLYALTAIFPFLILPLGLSNLLSNVLLGGLGPLDAIGGFAAGILTSSAVYLIKKFKWSEVLVALPIIFIPGLLVPVWLSIYLELPYSVLAVNLCIGQIAPGVLGVLIIKYLNNTKLFNKR